MVTSINQISNETQSLIGEQHNTSFLRRLCRKIGRVFTENSRSLEEPSKDSNLGNSFYHNVRYLTAVGPEVDDYWRAMQNMHISVVSPRYQHRPRLRSIDGIVDDRPRPPPHTEDRKSNEPPFSWRDGA